MLTTSRRWRGGRGWYKSWKHGSGPKWTDRTAPPVWSECGSAMPIAAGYDSSKQRRLDVEEEFENGDQRSD